MRRRTLLWLAIATPAPAWAQAAPVFSGAGSDADEYGADQGYPARRGDSSNMPQRYLVGNYSRLGTLYPHHVDPAAAELGALWQALVTRCGR